MATYFRLLGARNRIRSVIQVDRSWGGLYDKGFLGLADPGM
jgi:hypothetical protein